MGAGYINQWLEKKVKEAFVTMRIPIDTLFIDAKQLYYSCIRKGKPEVSAIKPFISKLRSTIFKYLPNNFLFISIDGPNPAAKFQTQRYRKYKREHKQSFCYPTEPFNMLATIQPADELDKALKEALEKLKIRSNCIFYSSGFSPGEAEHKYFNFFRESKKSPEWIPNQNHFIFSGDNDLIILALQFMDENFYVIKPNGSIISISIVRDYLLKQIHDSLKETNKQIDDTRVIHDIIALSFLLGNDFIPQFPDLNKPRDTLDSIINAYITMNQKNGPDYIYLIENDSINVTSLQKLLESYFNKPITNPDPDELPKFKLIAQDILRILNFTWLYYSNGTPSWTYYYPHTEVPYLFSLVPLMVQEGKEFFEHLPPDEITEPFLKALVIHPPDSQINIPWGIYKLKIPPSPIAEKFWPIHKERAKLPMFDLIEIKTFYKNEIAQLSPDELLLNRTDPPYFVYIKNQKPKNSTNNSNQNKNQRKTQNKQKKDDSNSNSNQNSNQQNQISSPNVDQDSDQ